MATMALLTTQQRAAFKKLRPDLHAVISTYERGWQDIARDASAGDLDLHADEFLDAARGVLNSATEGQRDLSADEQALVDGAHFAASRFKRAAESLMATGPASRAEISTRSLSASPSPLMVLDSGVPLAVTPSAFGLGPKDSLRMQSEPLVPAGVSFAGYLRAKLVGAKTAEEKRVLAEAVDAAGGFTVPDLLSREFIDRLRNALVSIRAGARTLNVQSDKNIIARVATDPTVAWRAENAIIPPSDPVFDAVTLTPQWLGTIVITSRELLMDSVNLDEILPRALTASMAVELDRVALVGTGTAPQPRGVFNTTGVASVAVGGALTWDKVLDGLAATAGANAAPPTAVILHPTTYYKLIATKDTQTRYLEPPAGVVPPILNTTSMPVANGLVGDFADLILAYRSPIQIEILRERYVENFQVGFLVWARFDVGVAHPASFARFTGIT